MRQAIFDYDFGSTTPLGLSTLMLAIFFLGQANLRLTTEDTTKLFVGVGHEASRWLIGFSCFLMQFHMFSLGLQILCSKAWVSADSGSVQSAPGSRATCAIRLAPRFLELSWHVLTLLSEVYSVNRGAKKSVLCVHVYFFHLLSVFTSDWKESGGILFWLLMKIYEVFLEKATASVFSNHLGCKGWKNSTSLKLGNPAPLRGLRSCHIGTCLVHLREPESTETWRYEQSVTKYHTKLCNWGTLYHCL